MQGVLPMNKPMLYTGLLSILSTTTYAELSTNTINNSLKPTVQIAAANQATTTVSPNTEAAVEKTTVTTTQGDVKAATDSSIVKPAATTAPAAITTSSPPTQPINCNYKIPAETTKIEQTVISQWAEKAALQSFDFDNATIDKQLAALKSCFTDQGWQSFNDALQKSGNLNAIKSQKLMVSSMLNGKSTSSEMKENQWKVSVPLQVVYQNDKEKLTQSLTVDIVVGRKISGDLGIMQMIASPNPSTATDVNATSSAPKNP
jgi:hypothetical protein